MKPENRRSCKRVLALLGQKLDDLAARIAEMERFRRKLSGFRKQCGKALTKGDACPVILTVADSTKAHRKT
jgi:hypothetical protein